MISRLIYQISYILNFSRYLQLNTKETRHLAKPCNVETGDSNNKLRHTPRGIAISR